MAPSFYPYGARQNNYSPIYCRMAIDAACTVLKNYAIIEKNDYDAENIGNLSEMNDGVIAVVVFSAMTIEAFINDYAAACLGDADFYDNFDKLSVYSKFDLVARFIMGTKVDKSKSYYGLLRSLFKQRDAYVHGKSHALDVQGMTYEQMQVFHEDVANGKIKLEPLKLNKEETQAELKSAMDALKAIKEIALFFDEYDDNIYAVDKMFRSSDYYEDTEKARFIRENVFPRIGYKLK